MLKDLTKTAVALTAGILIGLGGLSLYAQTSNFQVPVIHGDVLQWGQNTVTGANTLSDAIGNPTAPMVGAAKMLWDTTQWVRGVGTALASFPTSTTTTGRNLVGGQVVERSSRWSQTSNPAASSQATTTIALESGVRHVADTVCFSAASTSAPSLTALTVNLRDGASGAGNVLATWQLAISASTGQNVPPFCKGDLNLVGTTGTAMTLEFSALLANLIESVTLTGWNVK